jgi:hypothetical protein
MDKFINIPIQIGSEFAHKLPPELIKERIQFLVGLFKRDYKKYFKVNIDTPNSLLELFNLSLCLEGLQHCNGFNEHVNEYKNDVEATRLVSFLAFYFFNKRIPVSLEPTNIENGKKSDILIKYGNEEIYIECKNPRKKLLSSLCPEQEPFYEVLKNYISKPCDIFIEYERDISDEDIKKIANFIKQKLPSVTGEGTILNADGIKISVTSLREKFEDIGEISLQMITDNYHEKAKYPINIINRNGIAIGFCKKNISIKKNIENQLNESRGKSPSNKPLILAIQADTLIGTLADNIDIIEKLFTPTKNTSFNGVLLFDWSYSFEKLIDLKFTYINNPYAKNPIKDISHFFIR